MKDSLRYAFLGTILCAGMLFAYGEVMKYVAVGNGIQMGRNE
jgi:hypothetical protein